LFMTRILLRRIADIPNGLAVAFALVLACGSAFAQPALDAPASAQTSFKLRGVIVGLAAGAPWLTLGTGSLFCIHPITQSWTGDRAPQNLGPYSPAFKTELEQAGFKVVTPGVDNLFDEEAGSADYEAAAVITDEHIDGCINNGGLLSSANAGDIRGDSAMKVDWQIYSPIKKQVVARISTSASAKLDKSVPGGVARLVADSFAANVRQLAANTDFRALMSAPKALTKGFVLPGQQSKIALSGNMKAPKQKIADAVGSVVTLFTGSGSGSGVLISDDGYILTNAHVVGDDKQIRVRWSDGIEALAQVVRVARDRDVAIVRTGARDRIPLAIKRGAVTPGQRVYAIGSPNGKAFQGTVSSGVVSATRIRDGLRFIQSDVSVSFGSSGGALLDESGSLIGLTVEGVPNEGQLVGLNLFIPIGDAMDFLSLEQQ
jgi:serine protease Do